MNRSPAADKPYSSAAKAIDKAFGKVQGGLFRLLTARLGRKDIPSYEDYTYESKSTFFKGTDGELSGGTWSAGFARGSVIPACWRCNADGTPSESGMCLNAPHATGGYQTFVTKIYADQFMNTLVLSCGDNGESKKLLIFISVDGAGISSATADKMRAAIIEALKSRGVSPENIIGCNISATHCHAALDTLGMSVAELKNNKFKPHKENGHSVHPEMEATLVMRAAETAGSAYDRMENGDLYFFETEKTGGVNDKLNCGVKVKNNFSCFLFEGASGEKTLLTNIGAHPTSYGAWHNNNMMCADYPHFMALALEAEGCNLVFTQSAQASVSGPYVEFDEADERNARAGEYVAAHRQTMQDWCNLYGREYAEKWHAELETDLAGHMRKGVLLALFILGAADKSHKVVPSLKVSNRESLIPFDYGVMELACVSGLLGTNAVKTKLAPSGYGVMTETNCIELGGEFMLLTAPGELSPAIVFGSDEAYKGHSLWNGKTSWSGKTWQYKNLYDLVLEKTGKKLILLGITNNELGYIYPDICTPHSLLGTLMFFRENPGDMCNCMLLTPGTECGSMLTKQLTEIIGE